MKLLLRTTRGKISAACVIIVVLALMGGKMNIGEWAASASLWLLIAFFISWGEWKYLKADKSQIWGKWQGCRHTIDQQRRIERAVLEGFNYKSQDLETARAVFIGSAGKYKTKLQSCTCPDFKKRKLPCKHMYRLAGDMGLDSLYFELPQENK